jgi:hypothetical protein
MTFSHGLGAKVYYHTLDFSDYVEEVDPGFERNLSEYAPLSSSWKHNLPGLRSFTISFAGLYDGSSDAIEDVAWGVFDGSTNRPFAYLPQGDALDGIAYCGETVLGDEKITAGDDVVRMPVTVLGADRADRCVVLHPLGIETSTGDETSVDGGASAEEDYGIEAYLICTSLTATDTIDVVIEDSDDDGVGDAWGTVVAFTQLSAAGSEHKTVAAATGVIKRYVRASWTVGDNSGSPSATFFVAFFRKTS